MSDAGFDAYLLCATPRSGSTLLCGLLESSGIAGHPQSFFNRAGLQEYVDAWGIARAADGRIDDAYLGRAQSVGTSANGVFGCRVMAETMPELIGDLAVTAPSGLSSLDLLTRQFGRLRFVHLRREDVVAQAVSWARALQTHYWHPGESVKPGGIDPHYDEKLITDLIGRIERGEAYWATWFAEQGIVPCEVTYDELAADPTAAARGVLDGLGLELAQDQQLVVGHRRQADDLNADWVRAYTSR